MPARYRPLFRDRQDLLRTHQGLDLGALATARVLRRLLGAPLIAGRHTRLLVDLNRSRHHHQLFSLVTRDLPRAERQRIVDCYWQPYRDQVSASIEALLAEAGRVIHVSVHSFTPVISGERRECDIGLLYDPGRAKELATCRLWQQALHTRLPGLRVRRNYPYRGTADGLVTALRRQHDPRRYIGIELELNQQLATATPVVRQPVITALALALAEAVGGRRNA
ncbi:MAG: N-formylglutamate amidohydrolase [Chromatiales bacterium]|nr:N-formylglutamate amidohydrolase [Chromatiales bacterium]